ncbi:hypothetical protein JCM19992_13570 [Thermostilla marina]
MMIAKNRILVVYAMALVWLVMWAPQSQAALPKLPKPKLPELKMPHVSLPNPVKALESGAEKLGQGIKALNPFAKEPEPQSRYFPTGSVHRTQEKKPSFFSKLFPSKKPEPHRPTTVVDWMKQPAPRP